MKKLFILSFALLLSVWALLRAAESTATQVLTTQSSGTLAAETVLINNDDLKATTVFDATCKSNKADFSTVDPSLKSLSNYFQLRVAADPSADNPNGTLQQDCTPVVFEPKKDMTLSLFIKTGTTKSFIMTDKSDFSHLEASDKKTATDGSTNSLFFYTYDLKADHEYVLSERGGTGQFYGFEYTVASTEEPVEPEEPEEPWVAEYPHTWDFTNWSEETVNNLKASDNWSDDEKGDGNTVNGNCFWQVDLSKELSYNKYLKANGEIIKELEGLVYKNTTNKRNLAIAVNYPKALSDYEGGAYLWLGGGAADYFIIPSVPAGATIEMGVESHKTSDARGVELSINNNDSKTVLTAPDGSTVSAPKTYTKQEWLVPVDAAETNDILISNTNGCHIYYITVTPPTEVYAKYTIRYVADGVAIKEDVTKTGVVGEAITLTSADKGDLEKDGVIYRCSNDDSADKTISEDGNTVVTLTYTTLEIPTLSWDFTKWSDETVANLKAGSNWSDIETGKTDAVDGCYWIVDTKKDILADKYVMANGSVIDELAGLVYKNSSLAIAFNYPETSLGKYKGPSYLWFTNGKGGDCFTIPNVPAGATIKMGVESHKLTDPRGVELSVNGNKLTAPDGSEVALPTEYAEQEWLVPTDAAENNDVLISNTAGCHIYYITVVPNEGVKFADYTLNYQVGDQILKTVTKSGLVGSAITLTDDDKAQIIVEDTKYKYVGDDSDKLTIAANGETVVTLIYEEVPLPNDKFGKGELAASSIYPANKATMLPLDGSIKLNFASDVNVGDATKFKATLNDKEATLTADGQQVAVSYSGLEPLTEYTLTIPAGAIGNADSQIMEDLKYSFTTRQADVLFYSDFKVYPEEYYNKYGNISDNTDIIAKGKTATVEVGGMTFHGEGSNGRIVALKDSNLLSADTEEDNGASARCVQMISGAKTLYAEFPEMEGPVDVTFFIGNSGSKTGEFYLTDQDADIDEPLATFKFENSNKTLHKYTYSYPYSGKVKFRLYNNGVQININDALFVKGEGEGIEKPVDLTPKGYMAVPGELDINHSSWKLDGTIKKENDNTNIGSIRNNATATGKVYVAEPGVYSMNIDFYWWKTACDMRIEITDEESGEKEVDTYYYIPNKHEANILLEGTLTEGKKTIKYSFLSNSSEYLVNYRNQTLTKVGETYAALKSVTGEGISAVETEGYDFSFNIPADYEGETVSLKAELLNAALSVKAGETVIPVSAEGVFELPVPTANEASEADLTLTLGEGAYAGQTEFKLRLFHVGEVILSGLTFDGLAVDEESVATLQSEKKEVTIDGYVFTSLPKVEAIFKDGSVVEATGTLADDQKTATFAFQGKAGSLTEDYSFTLSGFHIYQPSENDKTDVLKYEKQYQNEDKDGSWSNDRYTISCNDGWDGKQFKMKSSTPTTLTAPGNMVVKQIKMACLRDNYVAGKVASVTSEGATVYLPSASAFQTNINDDQALNLVINVDNHVAGTPFVITFEEGSQPAAWFEFIYENIAVLGDANMNGKVEIADAIDIANYVVGKKTVADEDLDFYLKAANANGEGPITFADASATVKIALDASTSASTQSRIRAAYDESADALVIGRASAGSRGTVIPVSLENAGAYVAFQADIILPEGMDVEVKAADAVAATHTLMTKKHADNHIRVALFNFGGNAFAAGEAPVIEIVTDSFVSASDIVITDIIASDADANASVLASKTAATNGVAAIGLDEDAPVKVYDINGIYVSDTMEGLQQGTYIVRQGETAKTVRIRN